MNREIKFRVWDKDLKRMRYLNTEHDFICFHSSGQGYYENMQTGPGEWFSGLMQYTGLKDKNGKEVYEGDIFHLGDPNITYAVVYFDTAFKGKQKASSSYVGLEGWKDCIEVIGNIYEREVTNAKD